MLLPKKNGKTFVWPTLFLEIQYNGDELRSNQFNASLKVTSLIRRTFFGLKCFIDILSKYFLINCVKNATLHGELALSAEEYFIHKIIPLSSLSLSLSFSNSLSLSIYLSFFLSCIIISKLSPPSIFNFSYPRSPVPQFW